MAMNKQDMDRWSAQNCEMGCKHENPGEHPSFLHSSCHTKVPISMIYDPGTLVLSGYCAKCYKSVGKFQLGSPPISMHCVGCNMKPDEIFVWPSYTHGTGVLVLSCYFCKKETARLCVLDSMFIETEFPADWVRE